MKGELKTEKENVINLMVERDVIKQELHKYKTLWSELKKTITNSMQSGRLLYRKSHNEMWLHYADSDEAVLSRMREMEDSYGTSDNL